MTTTDRTNSFLSDSLALINLKMPCTDELISTLDVNLHTKIFTSIKNHIPPSMIIHYVLSEKKTWPCIKSTAGKAVFFMQPKWIYWYPFCQYLRCSYSLESIFPLRLVFSLLVHYLIIVQLSLFLITGCTLHLLRLQLQDATYERMHVEVRAHGCGQLFSPSSRSLHICNTIQYNTV